MTRQQATATGLLGDFGPTAFCTRGHLRAAPNEKGVVLLSKTLGIATIDAYGSVTTPEGAHIGMATAEIRRLYPAWKPVDGDSGATDGRGNVKVPGNSKASYRIVTRKGVVTELTLQFTNQNCYE
ncbi:hypothetical protein [Micromonospora sp. 067-2]|uniref:hypothetical protein n=1 Tax=Micromonospora sp. 067-2 TaxID=2789270 RepID=UPI003979A1CF